jgi:hypothetical protein
MTEDKSIKYINKTFSDFKTSLQEFSKTYFPNTYNDFSEASPGNMFMEMAAYVGDVSSFYIDSQIQENFLNLAKEKESLYNLAYSFGYRPKVSYASNVDIDLYQLVPSIISGSGIDRDIKPDLSYSLLIGENTIITSGLNGQTFITTKDVDFSNTSSVSISYTNDNRFLLRTSVPAVSATIKTTSFTFNSPKKFDSIIIEDENILQILNIKDSDGNLWYEVPYLAQDIIPLSSLNPTSGSDNINYLLNFQKVPRRFVTRVKPDNKLEIQFGSGMSFNILDTTILPTPENINNGLIPNIKNNIDDYNKVSSLFTQTYGLVPQNTTLTVNYLVGGGLSSNVPVNSLTTINNSLISFKYSGLNSSLTGSVLNSIACNNSMPAVGGRGGDTIEEIRLNSLNSYSAQNRTVTKEDYILRSLNMPSKYGTIAKAYITQETYNSFGNLISNNPLSLDLYILGYNSDKNIISTNSTLKNNLKKYLNQYRMITDAINIKDAFYINVSLNFEINIEPSYNSKELLSSCLIKLKEYFNIEAWQINQPIILSDIYAFLLRIPGVRSVPQLEIVNKQGGSYSPYGYDIVGATKKGIIYPSLDPSIFEIRYPDVDIKGRVIIY